jgi:hypothetical protein
MACTQRVLDGGAAVDIDASGRGFPDNECCRVNINGGTDDSCIALCCVVDIAVDALGNYCLSDRWVGYYKGIYKWFDGCCSSSI